MINLILGTDIYTNILSQFWELRKTCNMIQKNKYTVSVSYISGISNAIRIINPGIPVCVTMYSLFYRITTDHPTFDTKYAGLI